jgi:hypothetical protein
MSWGYNDMEYSGLLSDYKHPIVTEKAASLTSGLNSDMERLESIFYFVRDGIEFGFPPTWDRVKASEVVESGIGYCNTKATLLIALCRASGILARAHCGLISIEIMRGVFPSFSFPFLPKAGGHTWCDVQIDDHWRPIDSYINDQPFYESAKRCLAESGRKLGYSISFLEGRSSCEFNFGDKGFVHMGAVLEDHGVWEDLSQYFDSEKYVRMNPLQTMCYPILASIINRNIRRIRSNRN